MLQLNYEEETKRKAAFNFCTDFDTMERSRIEIQNHQTVENLERYSRLMFSDL